MSDNSLPDEIVSEILSPALKVSDEVFSDTANVSPFAGYGESTSAYLLVCKSWLRVATPLLYHVVILRSKAQAKALAQVLSKNQILGQFIKKLRVEGGYGPAMGIIMKLSPNISDIFISFEIWATDNTEGLCNGLLLINPTRIILRDLNTRKRPKNKMVSNLEHALVKAFSEWDRLSIIDFPYASHDMTGRGAIFAHALATSQCLKTVVVPWSGVSWIHSALKTCPLDAIWIREILDTPDVYLRILGVDTNPSLKALLKWKTKPMGPVPRDVSATPDIAPSLDPWFTPMKQAPKGISEAIWARVFYFAMFVPELADNPEAIKPPKRLSILQVSRTFNRLAMPHFYAHISLKRSAAPSSLLTVLRNNPSLGPQIRSICGLTDWDSLPIPAHAPIFSDSVVALFSQTTGLLRVGSRAGKNWESVLFLEQETAIPWAAFAAVAKASGSTLREFSKRVNKQQGPTSPAIFDNFTQLRYLEWKCDTVFNCKGEDVPLDGLPNLEELRVWCSDPSFFIVLSMMNLNSLRSVTFPKNFYKPGASLETFFAAHGDKLTKLYIPYHSVESFKDTIFLLCKGLHSISLYSYANVPKAFHLNPPQAAQSLTTISIHLEDWYKRKDQIDQWETLFTQLELENFPNLREIQANCFEWPTSEREIAKSSWVRWAERILEHKVSLLDKNGKKWRPRLKLR